MKRIISFCLWGENPKYTQGALRNAELIPAIYPGWRGRFHADSETVPLEVILDLAARGAEVVEMPDGFEGWKGMLSRFLPTSEDDVEVMLSRDCDSRISKREAAAVNEWLASNKAVHSMADHPYHYHPKMGLMGGLVGFKQHAFPQMKDVIARFISQYPDAWQCDQSFLRDHVFPLVAHKLFATSDIHPGCNKFPLEREGGAFAGEIIGAYEEIIHPEHRAML